MPITLPQQNITLVQDDTDFISLVRNRITMYGRIPYDIPQQLIIDIIKESARLFFKHDFRSTSRVFMQIRKEDILDFRKNNPINNYEQLRGYGLILPGYVQVVKEVYRVNVTNIITVEEITEISVGIIRTSPYGSSLAGINSSMYNLAATCKMVEQTAYQSLLGRSVSANYSPSTQHLFINEPEIENGFILECLVNVPIQNLYQNDLYIRHVIGRCKQELKRLIGGRSINLPGGVTVNAEEICNNLEDIQTVEDILKAGDGIGDIIMFR